MSSRSYRSKNMNNIRYKRQTFCFPDSVIYYITKKPSNSKLYQKIIQSCKYFFAKNPIIVLNCLWYTEKEGWKTCLNKICSTELTACCKRFKKMKFDKNDYYQIWINTKILNFSQDLNTSINNIIDKIYQCDVEHLEMRHQNITFNEFLFLSSAVKECSLKNTVITYNGVEITLEKILQTLIKVKKFYYHPAQKTVSFYSNTVSELMKLSHFVNIKTCLLEGLLESFEIEAFYLFLKGFSDKNFCLSFCKSISEEYKNRLNDIIDKILNTLDLNCRPPYISFPGMDNAKKYLLFKKWCL